MPFKIINLLPTGNNQIKNLSIWKRSHENLIRCQFESCQGPAPMDDDHKQYKESEPLWGATERPVDSSLLIYSDLPNECKEASGRKVGDGKRILFEQHVQIQKLIASLDEDNLQFLKKLRDRIDRVGLRLPTIEVRYQNISIEAKYKVVQGKPLPTPWRTIKGVFTDLLNLTRRSSETKMRSILKDVSGIIKPARFTLLLGPPSCGKTTFLQALAGVLDQSLKVTNEITYNGHKFSEFIPQNTSAYICQYDAHIPEMTIRETLDFSAHCQGVGNRVDILKEIIKREVQAGIIPEPDIDTYMKAISVEGLKRSVQIDYILKVLGLETCADTIVGNAMRKGISGGQKRRLTMGEMIIGPKRALFMDEISNGLDSSTTFQIIRYMHQLTHITDSTTVIALVQPSPEIFNLFDDLILMAEGKVVYHGPCSDVQDFFNNCGFKCPMRKGVADFLQEVLSEKDQAQYWCHKDRPYYYVAVDEFIATFKAYHLGQKLNQQLFQPFNRTDFHRSALSYNIHVVSKTEVLAACMSREWLLMKRNAFTQFFMTAQLVIVASITTTVFIKAKMVVDVILARYYMGALFYTLIRLLTNGVAELPLTISRLPVFYKQRDFYFYPAWAYSIPAIVLKIPFSLLDVFLWTSLTYYMIGYSPEPKRFFHQFVILFLVHQVAISLFRMIAAVARNPSIAAPICDFSLLVTFFFGGFVIPRTYLHSWIEWGFWFSPLSYAEIAVTINELLAPRWRKESCSNVSLGKKVLMIRGLDYGAGFYWISVCALVGFWIIFNTGFTLALSYMRMREHQVVISHKSFSNLNRNRDLSRQETDQPLTKFSEVLVETIKTDKGMLLPFKPLTITFRNVYYFTNTPKRLKGLKGTKYRVPLLQDITGTFRPGVLTALMGVSGAGKTTLMDVLSGRKTNGYIEGDIRVGGYPKVQETYARISAYCEQFDVHSPLITVEESVMYSAWLRLPRNIHKQKRQEFVVEVLQLIELDKMKDALVGIPYLSGISVEQRKRLTIAVELVSNPSIIFMDEPTSGMDARAAAIVIRAIKNIVNTNRTIVCTIHQPSIDIFEIFDELILMKQGGQIIYSGELGHHSSKLTTYFEGIPGIPKLTENYNPATWMLEATSASEEARLGINFSDVYKKSCLYKKNKELVDALSCPTQDSDVLHFSTHYPQNGWEQFKACLWKQHLSYWRNSTYILCRLLFVMACALMYATLLWQKGRKMDTEQDFFNIIGPTYVFMVFTGISSCNSAIPYVASQRTFFYKERFSRMYSSWAYSLAQVIIEIPYIFFEAILFLLITYPSVNFYSSIHKILWYFYSVFCTLLYYKYMGMMLVSVAPTYQVAATFAGLSYTILSLFSGFIIPGPEIPKWWVWAYWICPTSWSLEGLLTSQYGDVNNKLLAFGEETTLKAFLDKYYGYKHESLFSTAIVLFTFPVVFALTFSYCVDKLKFQNR